MYVIKVAIKVDNAHHLPFYHGKCANIHGHTWKIIVSLSFEKLNNVGFTVDFSNLKRDLKEMIPDHRDWNDFLRNPTAENIAKYLFDRVKDELKLPISQIEIYESEDSSIIYNESELKNNENL
jgi:6-pyruvoyltetrahydropterin/6-carboxytetrahydropterin synthase